MSSQRSHGHEPLPEVLVPVHHELGEGHDVGVDPAVVLFAFC